MLEHPFFSFAVCIGAFALGGVAAWLDIRQHLKNQAACQRLEREYEKRMNDLGKDSP